MARIRVRARAVDMLGRQQIAGIPTAIHELFKNAHDAFARKVEVDYFRGEDLLILRDDGFGMTREEFESRWLTLGTESKLGHGEVRAEWMGEFGRKGRQVLGEKGIGRLAIAAIGPQVLVLTRASREDGLHDLVVSLIHWGLFELAGIDLDRVRIPVETLFGGTLPDSRFLKKLASGIASNLDELVGMSDEVGARIRNDLNRLTFNPDAILEHVGGLSLRGDGHGVHFIIQPADPIIRADIDESEEDIASPLSRNLLGFSNTMFNGDREPAVRAEFRDHLENGEVRELIGERNFFTPDEFAEADHHFDGRFDDRGQFEGTISVFGAPPEHLIIHWGGADGAPTACGPFRIRIAYVQGRAHQSRLSPEEFQRMEGKLMSLGGLYVYRDGVRILPYGNSDFDFLNIERRRTKSAQDWFFSFRRMFGAVEVTHACNPDLQEKAGREGFRSNKAYRQLKAILENFFMQLAKDYFRPESPYGQEYNRIKREKDRQKELLDKQKKRAQERKRGFSRSLDDFFAAVERAEPGRRAQELEEWLDGETERLRNLKDPVEAGNSLLALEKKARGRVAELRKAFKVSRPAGIALTKSQKDDWQAYLKNAEELEVRVCLPLEERIELKLTDFVENHRAVIDQRKRVQQAVSDLGDSRTREARALRSKTAESVSEVQRTAQHSIRESLRNLDRRIQATLIEFERTDTRGYMEEQLLKLRDRLESEIAEVADREIEYLDRLRQQMHSLAEAIRERDTLDEVTAAVEDRASDLEAELDKYTEWAQTGMAIGIVQHEFTSTVKQLRQSIRDLKPWADGTPDLREIHNNLRNSFEHLDGYLGLFTPLNRRMYRKRISLSGEEIHSYLMTVFGDRLDRHSIRLHATREFDRKSIHVFPSTFLPVFINVVDNAIYWINSVENGGRWIRLDADGDAFLVSNGGPGVDVRYADRIFEFGESFKSGYGRGMGLYISRQNLNKEGWDITLDEAGKEIHPVFRIAPGSEDAQEVEEDE